MANQQTQTASRPQQQQKQTFTKQAESKGALALQVNPPRLPCPIEEVKEYGITPGMWRALIDSTWPSAKTVDGILLALSWCKMRGYDPIKKPCHVVPIWSTALKREVESVWPSIFDVRATAHRTGQYAGCDETVFGPETTSVFTADVEKWEQGQSVGFENKKVTLTHPAWAQVTVYRIVGGEPRKFVGPKVHFLAAYGAIGKTDLPNEKWSEPGAQMLDKCAEAAALRKAFPEEVGDQYVAEEMENRKFTDFGHGMAVAEPEPGQQQKSKPKPQQSDFRDVKEDGSVAEGGGGDQEAGRDLVDEVGEVVETIIEDDKYCDAVIARFNNAPDMKALQNLGDNNVDEVNKLPSDLKRKAYDAYSLREQHFIAEKKKGQQQSGAASDGKPQEQQQPATGGQPIQQNGNGPATGLTLFNAMGKPAKTGVDPLVFGIEIAKLFDACELLVDLEKVYRHNAETVRDKLPESVRASVIEAYDQAFVAAGGRKQP